MSEPQVLIAGGGPVGLTLAIDLGQRGIACTVIDAKPEPNFLPKMERCNARSMEIYRRLGLADEIREAGLPSGAGMDVAVTSRLLDEPLVRLVYPSVDQARELTRAASDGTRPLEPYQVISQYTLEPLLKRRAEALPAVDVRFGHELVDFVQDDTGVTATVERPDGTRETVRAGYLVGCDGGRSTVRKKLGIALEGDGGIAVRNQVFFRSEDLHRTIGEAPCRMYFFTNADRSILTLQDDPHYFRFNTSCSGDEAELRRLITDTVGAPVDIDIVATVPWRLNLLVAERFGDQRVLLAGDAVRLVIPSGGLGLNTGIGDVCDLAWKLAATIEGWGGPALLESYETERRPVSVRNIASSRYAHAGQREWQSLLRPGLGLDTPEGRGTVRAVAHVAGITQRRTHEMVGTELGYRYEDSPVICAETGVWPPDVPEVYIPTARPGARLPHVWLPDGSALHDRLGRGYTLLRLAGGLPSGPLQKAFAELGAPLEVLDTEAPGPREVYGADLLLVRPDLHVAWRGDGPPGDPAAVARRVTGHR